MAARLSDDTVSDMRWSLLLDDGGASNSAGVLRATLMPRYLQQAAGGEIGRGPKVRDVFEGRVRQAPFEPRPSLDRVLSHALKPQWATAPLPLPAAFAELAAQSEIPLEQVRPGLWWHESTQGGKGRLLLNVNLAHRGPLPIPLNTFTMQFTAGDLTYELECRPERGMAVLRPAEVASVLCQRLVFRPLADPASAMLVQAFSEGSKAAIRFSTRDAEDRLDRKLAPLLSAELAAFRASHADCRTRDSCDPLGRPGTEPVDRYREGMDLSRNWLILFTSFWAYCGLALWVGNKSARRDGVVMGTFALLWPFFDMGYGLGAAVTRESSALMGIGAVVAVFGALLWAWIGTRIMYWCFEGLFGSEGVVTWVYRSLRREPGDRRSRRP